MRHGTARAAIGAEARGVGIPLHEDNAQIDQLFSIGSTFCATVPMCLPSAPEFSGGTAPPQRRRGVEHVAGRSIWCDAVRCRSGPCGSSDDVFVVRLWRDGVRRSIGDDMM